MPEMIGSLLGDMLATLLILVVFAAFGTIFAFLWNLLFVGAAITPIMGTFALIATRIAVSLGMRLF